VKKVRVNISVDAENYGKNFETVGSADEIAKVIKACLDENVTEIRIKKQHTNESMCCSQEL
jgi:hypothetical protein